VADDRRTGDSEECAVPTVLQRWLGNVIPRRGRCSMLGDTLGSVTGKVVLRRVLAAGPSATRTESTQEGTGNLLGVNYREMSTYESELRPDGTLFGSGQGIYMGSGGEMATWVGQGVGIFTKGGGVAFRGALYLYSASATWQRLNAVASVFEYEVDAAGNYKGTLAEWK
jgi:hypothetical protein